jgi:acyl-coenzyme A synthetase/AMP-(fatty) acid ligase
MAMVTTAREINESGILEELQSTLPAWMLPQRIRIVPALPNNGNGKLDRAAVRSLLEGRPDSV